MANHAARFLAAFDKWQLPESLPRPRLFIPPSYRDALRSLPARDPAEWERLRAAAEKATSPNWGRNVGSVADPGMAFLISGDERYAETVVAGIEATIAEEEWIHSTHKPRGMIMDLVMAHKGARVAWAYDWLYDYLTPEQRERWRHAVLTRALEIFLPDHREGKDWWTHVTHNWRAVICGQMGWAAICLAGEWPEARESLRESLIGVVATLDANPRDGSYVEGPGYWSSGMSQTAWFAEALRSFTGGAVDLFRHPILKKTGHWGFWMTTPDLGSFCFGDNKYRPVSGVLISLLAARTKDPYGQWLAERLGDWHPLRQVWRQDAPEPKAPDDLPLIKHYSGAGTTVMRSDWSDQAIYVGLKTGETRANHSHLDINSIVLTAFGKPLLVDPGGWHYDHGGGFFDTGEHRWDYPGNDTVAHNTILIEGRGQVYGKNRRGKVTHLESTSDFDYAVGEAASAYGPAVTRFDRHLIFSRRGYVILIDDIETKQRERVQWLFHPGGPMNLDELNTGRITIANEGAALDLDLLRPDPQEGRTSQRVELASHYYPSWDPKPEVIEQGFPYLSVGTLHRSQSCGLVAVLRPRRTDSALAALARIVRSEGGVVEIIVPREGVDDRWLIDLRARKANPA